MEGVLVVIRKDLLQFKERKNQLVLLKFPTTKKKKRNEGIFNHLKTDV